MNEEELRNQLLMPYLTSLGISAAEVSIEREFRIRLGHTQHAVGRADLLVRGASGDNLFVVELKNPNKNLTDADRDQGISYARLLDQIPPFVLVTNGRDSRLYDTITKAPLKKETFVIESNFFKSGGQLASPDDVTIRWEALSHFIALTPDNVRAFTRGHLEIQLSAMTGTTQNRGKYIREIYVPRLGLRKRIEEFLSSSEIVFAVCGDSGVGKTNELCALAEELVEKTLAFFLTGHSMTKGPAETLAEALSWGFSHPLDEKQLIDRLAKLGSRYSTPVTIIVDAIDEISIPNVSQIIDSFINRLITRGGSIRLIVSLKSTEIDRFSAVKGNPTALSRLIGIKSDSTGDDHGGKPKNLYALHEFDDEELELAIERYRKHFRISDRPNGPLRQYCRTPFFLRVISDTYAERAAQLPTDLTRSDVARAWLNKKLAAMENADTAMACLLSIVARVYKKSLGDRFLTLTDSAKDSILVTDLPAPLERDLITSGVLIKFPDIEGRQFVRLHHTKILSYLIARHHLRLDLMSPIEFRAVLPDLFQGAISQDALAWHLRECPDSHLSELSNHVRGRAALFLENYKKILDIAIAGLREHIDPQTSGDIGIGYFLTEYGVGAKGLFPLGEFTNERIVEIRAPENRSDPTPLLLLGCRQVSAGGRAFDQFDPAQSAAFHAFDCISRAIHRGDLNEFPSPTAVQERILAIASGIRSELGLPRDSISSAPFASLLPINLVDLQISLQKWFGTEYYLNRWVSDEYERINAGILSDSSSRAPVLHIPHTVRSSAIERSEREAKAGHRFPAVRVSGKGDLDLLQAMIAHEIGAGRPKIEHSLLPSPHVEPWNFLAPLPMLYGDEDLLRIMSALFDSGLEVYQAIVDRNMTGLREHLHIYQLLPCHVVAVYDRPIGTSDSRDWGHLSWGLTKTTRGSSPRSVIYMGHKTHPFHRSKQPDGKNPWVGPDGSLLPIGFQNTNLGSLLRPDRMPQVLGAFDGYDETWRLSPIRSFAYDLLRRDLEGIGPEHLLQVTESKILDREL